MNWCWLGIHSWTLWVDKDAVSVYPNSPLMLEGKAIPTAKWMLQERRCNDCNKLQIRSEKEF